MVEGPQPVQVRVAERRVARDHIAELGIPFVHLAGAFRERPRVVRAVVPAVDVPVAVLGVVAVPLDGRILVPDVHELGVDLRRIVPSVVQEAVVRLGPLLE